MDVALTQVAHPAITEQYGSLFLQVADYMVGSPTAFADAAVEVAMRQKAAAGPHGLYIPSGALWGAVDIQKMAELGTLTGARVTMRKHPSSFKLTDEDMTEQSRQAANAPTATVLFEGPVRQLCPIAPNNVNTMACCALAAHTLGFDGVVGCLVADPNLDAHIVEIDVKGQGGFHIHTTRHNPAAPGAVTGNATYDSFVSSMHRSGGHGPGVHFC